MLRVATSLLLSTAVSAQAGYTTDTDVTIHQALGTKLLEVETAIESSPPDWSAAIAAYQEDVDGGDGEVSLANIGKKHGDGPSNSEYRKFTAFHGNNADYANDFVHQALSDTFHPRLPLSSSDGGVAMMDLPDVDAGTADRSGSAIAIKSRQEMVMKGIALQSLMMVRVAAVLSVPLRSSSLGALRSLDAQPWDVRHSQCICSGHMWCRAGHDQPPVQGIRCLLRWPDLPRAVR